MFLHLLRLPWICLAALYCAVGAASAQPWPEKPIRLIVPAPPGGISDAAARLLAEQLRLNLGQTVLVDNKPGGSAVIAERALMGAPADGHTLMVGPSSVLSDIPLAVKTPFDPLKTFTYVGEVTGMFHVLVANAGFAPNTVEELLAHARKNPRSVSVANLSTGTRSNLLGEMLRERSGNDILVVPYKGSAPALVDLMGNQVQLTFEVVSNVAPLVRSGKLKGLAVASPKRSRFLPDVPTFGELGLPGFMMPDASVGVFVLSSMPLPLQEKIRAEVARAVQAPKFREALLAQNYDPPRDMSLQQLRQTLDATAAHNRAIIEKLQLKISPE
ncbi:tripartite tricarboxylate transporter substrate binding protein [Variovorax sp. V59]|uniref:Bug family tripartite tricarboxylate transporter substrate binding protein n=1 Tax=unclassified Variovorax TaxID=663243 RepID=UPI0034E8BA3A